MNFIRNIFVEFIILVGDFINCRRRAALTSNYRSVKPGLIAALGCEGENKGLRKLCLPLTIREESAGIFYYLARG